MSKKFVYIALFIALIFVSLSSSAASETNNVNITDASEYDIDVSNAYYAEVIEETNEAQSNIENKNNINSEIWVSPDGVGDGSTQDNPSNLTYALDNIKENSIIYVLDGEYTTSRTYGIDVDNIIIKSVNPDSVIFYKNYYSFFDVKANNFMLEGITFLSSRSGEDVINWYGENGTVKDCKFINLTSSAIMAYETASNLKILNSNFINNTRYKNTVYIGAPNFVIDGCKFIGHNDIGPNAVLQGGAIYCDSPNGTIINSEFYNNEASWLGGAIFYSNFVNASIINCTFFNNSAGVDGFGGDGGAIYFELSNNSNIINCTFVNNSIDDGTGGAIEGYSGEYTNIINCTFIGNKCGYDSYDDEYGGAVCWDVYNGTIINSVFINNIAENGGALNLFYAHGTTVKNCTFINNTARTLYGGAIYSKGKDTTITNCTFIENTADFGGAIFVDTHAFNNTLSDLVFINNYGRVGGAVYWWNGTEGLLNNSIFINNTGEKGGAIYIRNTNVLINDCIIVNSSAEFGGAIYIHGDSVNTTIKDSLFINNSAITSGGASYDVGENTTFNNCDFIGNNAVYGTIYTKSLNGVITGCNFVNNTAKYGGAIYVNALNYVIENSNIINNTATAYGGAIYVGSSSENTRINNVKFENNSATEYGGAIEYLGSNGVIANSTFVNNNALYAGAIDLDCDNVTVIDSIFNSNNAEYGGSIIVFGSSSVISSEFTGDYADVGQSIYNEGELYLKDNVINSEFASIYNEGLITSPVTVVVLNNSTVYVHKGDKFNLSAVLVDDNNNRIIGGNLSLIIENQTFSSVNYTPEGEYIIEYSINKTGQFPASGSYGNGTDVSIKNGMIVTYLNADLNISIDDIYYGNSFQINVSLKDEDGNNLSDLVSVIVNGKEYLVPVTNGVGSLIVSDILDANRYQASSEYNEQNYYAVSNTTFNVLPVDPKLSIVVNDTNYGEDVIVDVFLDGVNGTGLTGTVTVEINGKNYTVSVTDGYGSFIVSDALSSGNYTASVFFNGSIDYNEAINSTLFEILPINPELSIVVNDTNYGEDVIVDVFLNGINGTVTVELNGKNYTVNVTDGYGSLIIPDALNSGNYVASVVFNGNVNYNKVMNNTFFDILPVDPELSIVVNDTDYGEDVIVDVFLNGINDTGLNSTVTIELNNKNYTVSVTDGHGSLIIPDALNSGNYVASVVFNGNVNYNKVMNNTFFDILPVDPELSIVVNDTDYGDDVVVDVFLDGVNGAGLTGTVTVEINGKNYTVSVTDGYGSFIVSDMLDSGNYTGSVFFNGSIDYNEAINSTIFDVLPVDPELSIIVNDTDYGDDVVVDVFLNGVNGAGLTGTVTVEINGKNYTLSITDGYGSLIVPDALNSGNYTASVVFNGTVNYNKVISNTTFTVNKIVENITDVDNETTDIDNETSTDIDEDTTPDKEDLTESTPNQENYQKDSNLLSSDNINKGISMSKTGIPILALLLLLICAPLVLRKK